VAEDGTNYQHQIQIDDLKEGATKEKERKLKGRIKSDLLFTFWERGIQFI